MFEKLNLTTTHRQELQGWDNFIGVTAMDTAAGSAKSLQPFSLHWSNNIGIPHKYFECIKK